MKGFLMGLIFVLFFVAFYYFILIIRLPFTGFTRFIEVVSSEDEDEQVY